MVNDLEIIDLIVNLNSKLTENNDAIKYILEFRNDGYCRSIKWLDSVIWEDGNYNYDTIKEIEDHVLINIKNSLKVLKNISINFLT